MAVERGQVAKREILWLTRKMTTRDCIYVLGSFAIYSLRFFLHFFADWVFSVGKLSASGVSRVVVGGIHRFLSNS